HAALPIFAQDAGLGRGGALPPRVEGVEEERARGPRGGLRVGELGGDGEELHAHGEGPELEEVPVGEALRPQRRQLHAVDARAVRRALVGEDVARGLHLDGGVGRARGLLRKREVSRRGSRERDARLIEDERPRGRGERSARAVHDEADRHVGPSLRASSQSVKEAALRRKLDARLRLRFGSEGAASRRLEGSSWNASKDATREARGSPSWASPSSSATTSSPEASKLTPGISAPEASGSARPSCRRSAAASIAGSATPPTARPSRRAARSCGPTRPAPTRARSASV